VRRSSDHRKGSISRALLPGCRGSNKCALSHAPRPHSRRLASRPKRED
jgi:hypothetical protein